MTDSDSRPRLLDHLGELAEIVGAQLVDAQLYGQEDQGVHELQDLGGVLVGPGPDVHAARPPALHDAERLQLVKGIAHGRAADSEPRRDLVLHEPLAGPDVTSADRLQHAEHDPVSEVAIHR